MQPQSNHYYYGDYYDARYEQRGIYPWHSQQARRYGDDPMYAQYRSTQLRHDPDWDNHMGEQYRYRRDHVDARPPQTLALQVNFINTRKAGVPENLIVGRSLTEAVQSKTQPLRFTPVNMDERKRIETRGREVRNLQFERAIKESPPRAAGKSTGDRKTAQPVKMHFPASPVAARPTENVEGAKIPPPLPVAPKPRSVEGKDPRVKAQKTAAKAETRASEKKPEKVKRNVQTYPGRTDAKPAPANEKPQRAEPKPEATRRESTPQTQAPKAEPTKLESTPVKTRAETDSRSRTSRVVETPKPRKETNRSEALPPKSQHVQSTSRTEEAKREVSEPDVPTAEPTAQSQKPEVQPSRNNTKNREDKPEHARGTEDKKNKKGNK